MEARPICCHCSIIRSCACSWFRHCILQFLKTVDRHELEITCAHIAHCCFLHRIGYRLELEWVRRPWAKYLTALRTYSETAEYCLTAWQVKYKLRDLLDKADFTPLLAVSSWVNNRLHA